MGGRSKADKAARAAARKRQALAAQAQSLAATLGLDDATGATADAAPAAAAATSRSKKRRRPSTDVGVATEADGSATACALNVTAPWSTLSVSLAGCAASGCAVWQSKSSSSSSSSGGGGAGGGAGASSSNTANTPTSAQALCGACNEAAASHKLVVEQPHTTTTSLTAADCLCRAVSLIHLARACIFLNNSSSSSSSSSRWLRVALTAAHTAVNSKPFRAALRKHATTEVAQLAKTLPTSLHTALSASTPTTATATATAAGKKRQRLTSASASNPATAWIPVLCAIDNAYFELYYACCVAAASMAGGGLAAEAPQSATVPVLCSMVDIVVHCSPATFFHHTALQLAATADHIAAMERLWAQLTSTSHRTVRRVWEMHKFSSGSSSGSGPKRGLRRHAKKGATTTPNPLLDYFQARMAEGLHLFYTRGLGTRGDMATVAQRLGGGKGREEKQKKKKKKKKPHRRDTGAGREPPPAFELLEAWRDCSRDWAARLYAFAVPNQAALDALAAIQPLVELGAGTGYWAALLQQQGVDITALDIAPVSRGIHNEYHGRSPCFTAVQQGGAPTLRRFNRGHALFLCYPPPNDPCAQDALTHFKGTVVAHVGEWRGDTGTRAFESALVSSFALERTVALPNWGNTAYSLTLWRRRSAPLRHPAVPPSLLLPCSACGTSKQQQQQQQQLCAFSRTVAFCSDECARSAVGREAQLSELALRLVWFTAETKAGGGDAKLADECRLAGLQRIKHYSQR